MKKVLVILEIDQKKVSLIHSEELADIEEDLEEIDLIGKFTI